MSVPHALGPLLGMEGRALTVRKESWVLSKARSIFLEKLRTEPSSPPSPDPNVVSLFIYSGHKVEWDRGRGKGPWRRSLRGLHRRQFALDPGDLREVIRSWPAAGTGRWPQEHQTKGSFV